MGALLRTFKCCGSKAGCTPCLRLIWHLCPPCAHAPAQTRKPGPEFKALSEDDLSLRNTMRAMRKAGMGGTLFNRDEVMGMQDKVGTSWKGGGGADFTSSKVVAYKLTSCTQS